MPNYESPDSEFDSLLVQPGHRLQISLDGIQRLVAGLIVILIIVVTGFLVSTSALRTRLDSSSQKVSELSGQLHAIQTGQQDGIERGFKIKAVGCANLVVSLRSMNDLPPTCLDEQTLRYYDPNAIVAALNGGTSSG